jgi:EpsI family protein
MLIVRIFVAGLLVIAGIFATHAMAPLSAAQPHRPLQEFPAKIASMQSEELLFETGVVKEIGVDDYINREYFGDGRPVELYIGYYKDQRSGDAIHSPRNFLPGSGWEPIHSSRVQIGSAGETVIVNEYLVEKGNRRDLVLYWYQTHGRIIASEYWAKFWLVADGVRHKSTDGALIRIWTTAEDGEHAAETRATQFARQVYPQVSELLPN